jgi:hypothetical protein
MAERPTRKELNNLVARVEALPDLGEFELFEVLRDALASTLEPISRSSTAGIGPIRKYCSKRASTRQLMQRLLPLWLGKIATARPEPLDPGHRFAFDLDCAPCRWSGPARASGPRSWRQSVRWNSLVGRPVGGRRARCRPCSRQRRRRGGGDRWARRPEVGGSLPERRLGSRGSAPRVSGARGYRDLPNERKGS